MLHPFSLISLCTGSLPAPLGVDTASLGPGASGVQTHPGLSLSSLVTDSIEASGPTKEDEVQGWEARLFLG